MASAGSTTIDHGKESEMDYAKKFTNDKDVIWWKENIEHRVTPEARKMLEEYSSIPPDEVLPHIYRIRDKAGP
ncbi:hypothetical protein ONS95_002717 [Cadophora gregata]|uniref:uncharacterized protein n=1 Tax=Cadophora gregata TaxID=51156 RepID=UPI0026DC3FC2|nr:uncharacterized protein ONS95_002717 [Cadophora gregata]KAK0110057.1 hypothetical protein ONS95_002717 [Cadophora gregata]KAK0110322.1 hypothetical protein ONS96_001938 [Cadophora gregata f. sp. sojae]